VGALETASLTIPADIHTVGWWDGTVHDGDSTVQEDAPAPGQPGVALIAGHVDSAAAGPGALHGLGDLKAGDTIKVSDSAGDLSTWRVDAAPQTNLKSQLPAALWVTTGAPKLAVVTCGGPFDPATGHYEDNVIVWADQDD
jgi:Sortase domain